ncbi:hypothetical protein FACS1894176_03820 [Bacteroidia bacterium]|nr:hypothetical protein FACS1894176_03820 [Bacteroidia bacterium]
MTAFVAFVIVIYSFYMMFFQENSKGIDQVKKNLKGVAIALVIMGLSRLIVSFIFNFYKARASEANLQMLASSSVSVLLV